jgi:arylsulfatase A-like enzyme
MKRFFSRSERIQFVFILVFFSLILYFSFSYISCRKNESRTTFFRFIDHLSANSIIETPLEDLERKFEWHKQKLNTDSFDFTGIIDEQNYRVTGYSTDYPILAFDDDAPPDYLKINENGKPMDYLEDPSSEKEGWRWIKGEKRIFLKKWFYRKEQITGKTFYGTDIILPAGKVMFEILSSNNFPSQFAPELQVSLNGKLLGSSILDHNKRHIISSHVKMGNHKLRLLFKKPKNFSGIMQKHIEIFIGQIRIKSLSDIILVYHQKSKNQPQFTNNYEASYLYEPFKMNVENGKTSLEFSNPSLHNLYNLYKLNSARSTHIHDYGVGSNPKNLKKKLELGEDSINAIFAPTPSTYVIETKIPDRGYLQFGYGLLPSSQKTAGKIGFQVIIERAGKKEILFNSNIDATGKSPNSSLHEKISLEKYQKKRAKIYLVTDYAKDNDEQKHPPIHYAYWYNPLIYQKLDDNSTGKNLILISLDTLRADHLGSAGYERETSPNLDKLLEESIVFPDCYSTAPSTLRSHMSLLTGLDPISHQVYTQQDKLDPTILTLADILRVNNFTSAAFTGGGRVSAVFGFSKGFDRYYENKSSWIDKDTPEELLEKSLNWLEQNRDKNYFLFLHTYQPHDPYSNSSDFGQLFLEKEHAWKKIDLFSYLHRLEGSSEPGVIPLSDVQKENIVALYDGEIRYTDECLIKPLIEGLKNLDLYENTLIVITSDHGEAFYEHGMWMHGGQLYNELIKVPLIIKFPHEKHKGKKVTNNVSLIDITPTILKELGIGDQKEEFDGEDIIPLITGLDSLERHCFSEIPVKGNLGKVSVVYKDFKLILNRIVHKDKFISQAPPVELELYNLRQDSNEKNNLATAEEEMVKYLMAKIEEYLRKKPKTGLKGKEKPVIDEALRKRLKALGYIE